MLQLFFKTLFRNLWRNKTYSFLNIFGLAIGIACASLIFLWVETELSYDQTYAKRDNLYTIRENQTYDGVTRTFNSSPGPMAAAIKKEIPGIANTCRLSKLQTLFSVGDKDIFESGYYADPSFMQMFSLQFVQGNARDAFKQLYTVVITEKMAAQFFGQDYGNIIGKSLKMDNAHNYVVGGVVKNFPVNSTLQMDWIAPFEIYANNNGKRLTSWGNNSTSTFVELQPGANLDAINKQLYDFIQKRDEGAVARCFLFAMNDWHLRDSFQDGKQTGGRMVYIRMFTVIAWIILLIACINFMNLATARSEKRAKEVGVRKVLGAGKKLLATQFLGEALVMSLLAVVLGAMLIVAVLPYFNTLIGGQVVLGLGNPLHIAALLAIALICGLVSGSYPSLYLSSFNPIYVFKGVSLKNGGAEIIRKSLAVLQFSISMILIISTIIIYQQIQHIKNRNLGYDKDKLLSLSVHGNMIKNYETIRQDLLNTGVVENAGLNSFNTLSLGNNGSGMQWEGKDENSSTLISNRMISPELIPTLGLKVLEGRSFRSTDLGDTLGVVITQSFARLMGKTSAVGKIIRTPDDTAPGGFDNLQVIGVVNDYVYGDMYGKSDPVLFYCYPKGAKYLYVRMKDNAGIADVIARVGAVMKKDNPEYPFEYSFVDDQFNELFKSETLIGKLSGVFAGLAIFISCLGLFGLAAYTAERRTKEIGIRKVLGASVAGVTALLTKDFLQLIYWAAAVAFPVAWWAMSSWLKSYAYRITINWWVFIVAGVLTVVIALVTIAFQSIKAALVNPVKSLRSE